MQITRLETPPLTELASGLRFPEGPVWMPDGSIVLVEIEAKLLVRIAADGRKSAIAEMPGGPNGAALGTDGLIYVTNNGGFAWRETAHGLFPVGQPEDYAGGRLERVDPATRQIETLYTACNGRGLRGPNDLVLDAAGDIYFTDLGKTRATRDRPRRRLLRQPRRLADQADRRSDVDRQRLRALARRQGRCTSSKPRARGCGPSISTRRARRVTTASPRPTARASSHSAAAPINASTAWPSTPAGNICVATLINGGISVISPDGKSLRFIPMPDA